MTAEPEDTSANGPEPAEEAVQMAEELHQYDRTEFDRLFKLMEKYDASDLHLKVGTTPIFRVHGKIHRMKGEKLLGDDLRNMAFSLMTDDQRRRFAENNVHDFAYSAPGVGRFRVNVFAQRGSVSVAARRVKTRIPTFEELNLPPILNKIAMAESGLIVVGGITGSGKSTTLAAIIDLINKTSPCHILTIEDPIEYLHMDHKAFVNQREVGIDVEDYNTALKYVVRQDPDVILIGEMRDAESFDTALMAAETGHLVLGSIHTSGAPQTIGRILDLFGADKHPAIRQLLRFNFVAIICQKLLRGKQEQFPRVPCVEVMLSTPVVRKLIGEAEDVKLSDAIRAGKNDGMQDFNTSLVELINKDLISRDEAFKASPNPEALKMNLKGIYLDQDRKIIG
jgi:twitching motility protein PilT